MSTAGESPEQVKVYRPNQRHELGLVRTWIVMLGNVIRSRDLIWQLFRRDFIGAYKKSFIGITWHFLMPLLGIVSWVFLKRTNILNPGQMEAGVPYTVYVLVGSSMWGLFVSMFTGASQTLTAGQGLVMQVKYPHEALLFQQAARQIANFLIGFTLTVCVVWIAPKAHVQWQIVFLPFVLLPLMLLASAMGLMVSMLAVVAVDMQKIIERGMAMAMMFAPIVYQTKTLAKTSAEGNWGPMLYYINKWNPLTYLVCSARDIILFGRLYEHDVRGFALSAALALVAFLVSWRLFFVSEDKLIERMI